jgi:16S rRNA (guanine966-N2)-methyltransferase
VRIIAGEFGGRRLKAPSGSGTRPTGERVREAWFSIVGPALPGASVLDLFAGSGALGLEALSRGAHRAHFVERSRTALTALRANVAALRVTDRVRIVPGDGLAFAERLEGCPYDVVFADPPYGGEAAARLVDRFRADPFAKILGVEHAVRDAVTGDETRTYGDAAITFCYRP